MNAMDPRIAGAVILASSTAFFIVKRWTTGSFVKGRPEGGLLLWVAHVFNLFVLAAVIPAAAILLAARRLESLDPTIVDPGPGPLHLGLELSGLLLGLAGASLMCWALATMRGHFRVMGASPRPTDRLLVSGPYVLVRHPMYASALCLSLGLAVLTQSLAALALFGAHAGLILSLITVEEEGLRRAFGQRFAAYQSRVKRLIPLFY